MENLLALIKAHKFTRIYKDYKAEQIVEKLSFEENRCTVMKKLIMI